MNEQTQDCGCGDSTAENKLAALGDANSLNPDGSTTTSGINVAVESNIPHTRPGYGPVSQQVAVNPADAQIIIESRALPTNIFDANASKVKALAPGFASNTAQSPASIVELARALKNNVDLIWEHCANNLEFIPTYGSQKGAYGTLVDGFGNAFDLADVMVQLLRQAGYTADYMFGVLRLNSAQWSAWFGTDTNVFSASNMLSNGGIPNTTVWTGTEYLLEFNHVWVRVNISGTNYFFDPAFKSYQTKTGINLATAMGYNQTTFMNNARSGATVNADYVQNMNRTNVRANLQTYAMNLANWIKTNDHDASVDDILGGRTINPVTISPPLRQTSLPYQKSGSTPTVWTSIPNSYKTLFRVQYDLPNIDVTFYSADVYGKRLTLFFNASHQAELRLDGTVLGTSSAQTPGSWNSVLLSVTHPYPTTFADQSVWHQVFADKHYVIANAWGNASDAMSAIHLKAMKTNSLGGAADDAESVLGEALSVMWYTWNAQKSKACDLLNRMTGCTTVLHHQVGLVGYNQTTLTDLGMINWASSALDNNYDRVKWNDDALAMHGIAFEASLQKEMVNVGGVSSAPVIDTAVAAGQKIYDAKTANWTASVRPNLVNYSTATLNDIENWWINAGWRVAIPENGLVTRNLWTGFGYYARSPWQGAVGIITGGLKGGSGDEEICGSPCGPDKVKKKLYEGHVSESNFTGPPKQHAPDSSPNQNYLNNYDGPAGNGGNGNTGADPVDLRTGAFLFNETDLRVGSGERPYSLTFERFYDSVNRLNDGPLGLGWKHNFQMSVRAGGDGMRGLGSSQPLDAVAAIAELFISVDLYKDLTRPHDKFVTSAVMNQWLIEQLGTNVVEVSDATSICSYVKLPDGTYQPPSGGRSTLVKNGDGTYTAKTYDQIAFNFNSAGNIATVVYPGGVTVTFSYTSGKLATISNGMGRTLTFTWTGDYISSVSDGTGRSVSYVVNGTKNLTQFTNAESKITTYAYGLAGQMTQMFYPANPTTAFITNTYDSLGRVKEQKDALNHQTSLYLAGARSEVVDPVGNSEVSYWTSTGNLARFINGVGKTITHQFDGINRRIKSIMPEGNSVEYTLDQRSNVLQIRRKAKPGSGLADIVNTMTYHPTYNKVATFVDGLNKTTTFTYAAATGNLLTVQRPVIDGSTPTITFTWNARGQVITRTDETGIVTQFNYDSTTEKLTSVVHDFGTGRLNLTTQFGYNTRGDVTSVIDPRSKTTTFQFNNQRQMTQKTAPSPLSYVTNLGYNNDGRLTSVQRQTGDTLNPWQTYTIAYTVTGEVDSITNPSGDVTDLVYDNADRLWKRILPVSSTETRVWEFAYDGANRISTIKDPAGVTAETRGYSDNGLLTSVLDARSNLIQFTWDGFDRADKTIHPGGAYEQNQSYNANDLVLTRRTRSGNTVVFTFDDINRMKTRAPQGQPTVTLTYDLAGRLTKASKPVVSGDPSSGDFQYFYDTAGRFWKEQYPDGKVVQHVLDASGNVTKTTWPDSWYVERVYDEINRLTDIKLNGATTAAVHFNWNPLSNRTSTVFENGVTTNYTRELDDDLATLVHNFIGSSVTFTYGYNKSHQLISQQISDGANYMWHPPAAGTKSFGTANALNQYPTVGGVSHSYNSNGCLTGDGTWTFGYDTENHLLTANKTGVSVTNRFDPMHRVREHEVGSTKNRFIYAGWRRIADYDNTTLQSRYVYGIGLDEILIQVSSTGTKTYFHGNHQGSVVATSNASGAVINRYKYSPFGESPSMTGTTHGYTGQRYEASTGLYYYKLRHYSPSLGRFLQPDPIDFDDGLNLYTYVHNDGLNLSDPLGLKSPPPGGGGVPLGGGGVGWPNGGGTNNGTSIAGGLGISRTIGGAAAAAGAGAGVIIAGASIVVILGGAIYDTITRGIPAIQTGITVLQSGVDDLINDADTTPDANRPNTGHGPQYNRPGGASQALEDFLGLEPTNIQVRDVPNLGTIVTGDLPGGGTASYRPSGTTGVPTLQIDQPGVGGGVIRYP